VYGVPHGYWSQGRQEVVSQYLQHIMVVVVYGVVLFNAGQSHVAGDVEWSQPQDLGKKGVGKY
jgi:hypothetical protein